MLGSDHVKTGKDGVKHRNQQTKSNADLIEKKGSCLILIQLDINEA